MVIKTLAPKSNMYRVIYKVRNEDRWAIWKARIHTYEEAEYRMQQVTRILGVPARIQLMRE